ncbi:MAG: hypothetical protein HYU51_19355 [Candidatus Rokubacteria bacterium]|nr:hypothetical protein [Candidatus Rokubacteria bacterium]
MREVDLFVEHLIAFDELWNRSEIINLSHTTVRIASIRDLIEMASIRACDSRLTRRVGSAFGIVVISAPAMSRRTRRCVPGAVDVPIAARP